MGLGPRERGRLGPMARTSILEQVPPVEGPIVDLEWLTRRLREVGYVPEALKRLGALPVGGDWVPRFEARRRCEGDSALHVLARVFCLGLPEDPGRLDEALGEPGLGPLLEAGLVVPDGDLALSRAWLAPVGDQFFARDFSRHITARAHTTAHVLGVGLASLMAAHLTVRPLATDGGRDGALALDLGTGQGFQAAQLAPFCERVIATDLSARAVAFARWSFGMCGVRNADLRLGAFFEPVAELAGQFDCISTNPPFMIGPDPGVVAFSNGLSGDMVTERIAREAPAMLREGGFCTIVCNWHHDEDWTKRPREWVEGLDCDAWLIRCRTQDTRSYAIAWLGELDVPREQMTAEMLDVWERYYEANGIRAISFGALVLRRRRGGARGSWFRADSLDWNQAGGVGSDQVRRAFAGLTLLHEVTDGAALLDVRLVASPGLSMDQTSMLTGGAWRPARPKVRVSGPLGFSTVADDATLGLLAALDGTRTLRGATEVVLGILGGDRPAAQAWAIAQARSLLEQGALVPA